MYSDKDDKTKAVWRRAQADMRRMAQQYDMQAASAADTEHADELRALAEATRAAADALRPTNAQR